jgi:hypothetical protein
VPPVSKVRPAVIVAAHRVPVDPRFADKMANASTLPLQVVFSHVNSIYIIGRKWRCWGRPLAPAVSTREERSLAMPIHRLLEKHAFGPDEIRVLTSAFDDALRKLGLADRADPVVEVVARKIIELAQQGERDPTRLSERAIQALSR